MNSGVESKVIKPPIKRVTSGKIFKPSKAFLQKMWIQSIAGVISIWFFVILGFIGIAYLLAFTENVKRKTAVLIKIQFLYMHVKVLPSGKRLLMIK